MMAASTSVRSGERRVARRQRAYRDAVVVGGGMVGAAAALALARVGLDVTLVEARQPRPWQAGDDLDLRVVALAPSSARLLKDLGVWEAVTAARAHAYEHMHVWDAGSGATLDFDAAQAGVDTLGWIIENRLLQHQLWQALPAAGVHCLCPATVADFDDRDDHVRVTLADETVLETRLLVAADGAHSPLREHAGIGTRGHDYAQRGVVAHVTTERHHDDTAWQRFLADGPIALLPLGDGRSSLVWTLPEEQAAHVLAMDDRAFCDAVGAASDFRLGRITATSARAGFPLRMQLAKQYRQGRLVLLGDAAHVVHPLAGQGVNLGLRDARELRDTIGAGAGDPGHTDLLARYARRRRSADTLDAMAFDGLHRVFGLKAPSLLPWRGLGMKLVNDIGPVKRMLVRHAMGA